MSTVVGGVTFLTSKLEFQLSFWLLIFYNVHNLEACIFRLSFFGKCFEDHRAASLPVMIDLNQFLGTKKIFCSF